MMHCGWIRDDACLRGDGNCSSRVVASDDEEADSSTTTYPEGVEINTQLIFKDSDVGNCSPNGVRDIGLQRVNQAHHTHDNQIRVQVVDKFVKVF